MSKLTVTDFSKRTGSPFQAKKETEAAVHEETLNKMQFEKQKEKQNELMQKVNKKTAEYQSHKPSSGVFTEVTTSGAFTCKNAAKEVVKNENRASPPKNVNGSSGSKSLLGFPSSANDLALDAKSDLEADKNISKETKDKVIEKLFTLVSMVQHVFESKVRVMTELDKFKDTHMKNEIRREKEHSEQLYKLNMSFQTEVVQAIQRLKSEIDITRNITDKLGDRSAVSLNDTSEFNSFVTQTKNKINEQSESEDKTDEVNV